MDVYESPSTWTAEPVRPRWQLALRFAGSIVWFPVVCVLWVAVAAAFIVVGMFAEVITAFSNTLERGYLGVCDKPARLPRRRRLVRRRGGARAGMGAAADGRAQGSRLWWSAASRVA
jgi:hypothetical protein